MTPAERKAVGRVVEIACDLYAATMGNQPIYDNRDRMREAIRQSVAAEIALFDSPGYLAEYLIAANREERRGR
jgi:hypothetical protein